MFLFQKYKLWVTPQPNYDRTWSPPTSFAVDSEGRKTVLWVNMQLVQRKWVTTGGNWSLEIHSLWRDLGNPLAAPWAPPAQCSSSPLPLQSDLVFSIGRKVLELWTAKSWVQLQTWELTMSWPFEQLQAKSDTCSRWEPAYLGIELRTAEMLAALVLPSGLMAEILSD